MVMNGSRIMSLLGNVGEKQISLTVKNFLSTYVYKIGIGYGWALLIKKLPVLGTWVQSLGQEDPLKEAWQPTPVFLPGECYGQRSLAGYSPWSHIESGMTEQLGTHHWGGAFPLPGSGNFLCWGRSNSMVWEAPRNLRLCTFRDSDCCS